MVTVSIVVVVLLLYLDCENEHEEGRGQTQEKDPTTDRPNQEEPLSEGRLLMSGGAASQIHLLGSLVVFGNCLSWEHRTVPK